MAGIVVKPTVSGKVGDRKDMGSRDARASSRHALRVS
jgi:hypothetical protein